MNNNEFKNKTKEIIENKLEISDELVYSNNKKRGQSFTVTICTKKGVPICIAKYFNFLEDIQDNISNLDISNFSTVEEFINNLENNENIHAEIDEIIDSIEFKIKWFNRYVMVSENEKLNCFPPLLYYDKSLKMNDSFFGVIIEKYVNGVTLENRLRNDIDNRTIFVLDFLHQMGEILSKLYNFNIVHRDISPDNIMIENEKYVLIDPGVAKIEDGNPTQTGYILGKKKYASPEQYIGNAKDVNFSSDLYSVGIIALEILLKFNPLSKYSNLKPHENLLSRFERDIEDQIYRNIEENEISSRLLLIGKKLIQVDKRKRFDSVNSFLVAVKITERMIESND